MFSIAYYSTHWNFSGRFYMVLQSDLINPAVKYRPIPFWSWNDKLDPAVLREQIREMHKAGLGGFFMHARGGLKTAYLSPEWMECINACLDEAQKLGMNAWLYDENGWPSGFGGGIVNGMGVKYQQKYLRCEKRKLKECGTENTIAYYDENGIFLSRTAPDTPEITVIRCFFEINPYYVDNLDKNVVAEFIRATHEFYYETIPSHLLKSLKGIFTDEPQISRNGFPWSFVYEEEYRKEYGTEMIETLPFLFYPGKNSAEIRIRYWKLSAKLFNNNFMKQIAEWCDSHGWLLTGHHVLEEYFSHQVPSNGTIMLQYQHYHIPGVDVLGRVDPNGMAQIQLVSAAAQFGKKQLLTESFALTGWNFGFHGMGWIYQQQLARGINLLCQHLQGYSLRGLRKRDYPSSSFVHQPWWDDYSIMNSYFARAGMLLAEGEIKTDLLVLHPLSSVWKLFTGTYLESPMEDYAHSLQKMTAALETWKIPHHYADEIIAEENGSLENGKIHIGKCSYSHVLIPELTNLSAVLAEMLQKFHQAGGKIYVLENRIENAPLTIDGVSADEKFMTWFRSLPVFTDAKKAAETIASGMHGLVSVKENGIPAEDILSTWRELEIERRHGRFYFFANKRYTEACKVEMSLPATGNCVEVIDKFSGDFAVLDNVVNQDGKLTFQYPFASGEALMLFVSGQTADPGKEFRPKDFSELKPLEQLSNEFEVISAGEGNIFTLDHCRYRVDGSEWIYDNVSVIHHRLLKRKCDCDLEMEFDFTIGESFDLNKPLTLISETPELFEYALNGKTFSAVDSGKLFDHAFRKIPLPDGLHYGINTISMKCRYHQSQTVYKALEKAEKFETEYNKLTFDTEIECIYLLGDFKVTHSGRTESLERNGKRFYGTFSIDSPLSGAVVNMKDITESGMPFFSGKAVFMQKFSLTDEEAEQIRYLRFDPAGANSYRLKLNGKEAGFLFQGQFAIPVNGLLVSGENTLEIEMTVSLRNMLGPHHLEEGESYLVHTLSWSKEPNAVGMKNPPYNEHYCFVETGLRNLILSD